MPSQNEQNPTPLPHTERHAEIESGFVAECKKYDIPVVNFHVIALKTSYDLGFDDGYAALQERLEAAETGYAQRLLSDYDKHGCCPHPFLRSEDGYGGRTAPTRDQCDCGCHEKALPRDLVLQRVQASREYERAAEARAEAAEAESSSLKWLVDRMKEQVDTASGHLIDQVARKDAALARAEAAERARDTAQDDVVTVERDLAVAERLNGELVTALREGMWLIDAAGNALWARPGTPPEEQLTAHRVLAFIDASTALIQSIEEAERDA